MKTKSAVGLAAAAVVAAAVAIPSFSPETDQSRSLGSAETRWGPVYTTEISDGRGNTLNVAKVATNLNAINSALNVDSGGNLLLGNEGKQVNITASQEPTITIGTGEPDRIAMMSKLSAYITEADHDADLAHKADLVGGKVPESQMPPGAISKNYTVDTEAELVTLTQAVINDKARVGAAEPHKRFILWSMPPTDAANWVDDTGGAGSGSGDTGVVSWAGKTGVVIPEIEDTTGLRAELDDMARAEDLAKYALLDSPALTTPTATTPPANASGDEVMTAAGLRTAMAGNLGTAEPLMDGVANAGAATTVARSDHRHPSDTSMIAVADLSVAEPLEDGTAVAGTSTKVSREDHVHPISISTPDYQNREVLYYNPEGVSLGYLPVVIPSNGAGRGNSFVVTKDGYINCYLGIESIPTSAPIRLELLINNAVVVAQYLNFTRTDGLIRHNFGIFSVTSGDSISIRISSSYTSSINLVYATGSTYGLFFFNNR